MSVAGRSTAPFFESTTNAELTICTYWLVPTSPFVSGGRQTQSLACPHGVLKGRHAPSKFWIGAEIGPLPFFDCTTGSLTLLACVCGSSAPSVVLGKPVHEGRAVPAPIPLPTVRGWGHLRPCSLQAPQ
jgi:hypothetical protein